MPPGLVRLVFLFLALFLVLGFGIDDRASGGIDMDFHHLAIGSQHFYFPHRLVVFLFEFGLNGSGRLRANMLIHGADGHSSMAATVAAQQPLPMHAPR